jgi:hypothetical protein
MSKPSLSGLTASPKKQDLTWCRKKARELRGLRRELFAEWRELKVTLRLVIEELEGK